MSVERFFFLILSLITFIYASKVQINLFLDRNKIRQTKGKIIDIQFALPEVMLHRNAKLATFEYYVDGRRYVSKNSMKLPLSANIGDVKDIHYFIDHPDILYTKTKVHLYLSLSTSVICLLLGMIRY